MRLIVDDTPVEARAGDTVLDAVVRNGRFPTGCLCVGGDCPNCLATIDGIAYVRMCQTPATPGLVVAPFGADDRPELPDRSSAPTAPHRTLHVDTVVIGAGDAGTAEAARLHRRGHDVVVLEVADGAEALGIYPGPEVVARIEGAIVRMRCTEVVVATGATEIHPVVPGSRLRGILTPGALRRFAERNVELGRVVTVGFSPQGVEHTAVDGDIVRFEGDDRVRAVVVADGRGREHHHECDTVAVDLGTYPRDILARMAPDEVRVVGGAAIEPDIPECPATGVVCPCSGVEVGDLRDVWDRGFQELELLKRATLAGTGTCQGGVCTPYLRGFVEEERGTLQPTFTARPPARQLTIGEAAAGHRMPPIHRTALDGAHRRLGATMDRMGGWWRPWRYGSSEKEYWAVREAVSLGDVSTLGKVLVSGPHAVEFLERLYPCRVSDLVPGRSRYALLLAESGALMDDGLISRLSDTSFALTFTSGGASVAEAWLRDWANGFGVDVRIMDRTHSLGALNVTGPHAAELLSRVGVGEPPGFMRHSKAEVAGVTGEIFRLSFTGEVSYEIHHSVRDSETLWWRLMDAGRSLGVAPHGIETLQTLRLEKGHVIVGVDTEPDSTPRRLGMEWAVDMDKDDFIGRSALERTGRRPLDRRLVGLTMEYPAPTDGSPVFVGGEIGGYVTSAAWSPTLRTCVMLAWVRLLDGSVPETVTIDDRTATVATLPFYDPEGARARA